MGRASCSVGYEALQAPESKFYSTEVIYVAPHHSDWPIYCDTLLAFRDWQDGDLTAASMSHLSDAEVGIGGRRRGCRYMLDGPSKNISVWVWAFLCPGIFYRCIILKRKLVSFFFFCFALLF